MKFWSHRRFNRVKSSHVHPSKYRLQFHSTLFYWLLFANGWQLCATFFAIGRIRQVEDYLSLQWVHEKDVRTLA